MNYKAILKHYRQAIQSWVPTNLVIFIAYAIAVVAMTIVLPLLYAEIINLISSPTTTTHSDLIRTLVYVAVCMAIGFLGYRIGDFFILGFETRASKKVYDYALEKIQKHSYAFFTNTPSGALIAQVNRFVQSFHTLYNIFVWSVWFDGVRLIGIFTVLLYHSRILAGVFVVFLLMFIVVVKILLHFQIPKGLIYASTDSKVTARMSDIITNIITLKIFASQSREVAIFKDLTEDLRSKQHASWFQRGFWGPFWQGGLVTIFEFTVITIAALLWMQGRIEPGVIVLVQLYVIGIFEIVWNFGRTAIRTSEALTGAQEMISLFEKEEDVSDIPNAQSLDVTSGAITFDFVSFSYKDGIQVFDDVSLDIKSGEKVAIVGHSGAGKTTLVKLLLRFLDIQKGSITIDGQNIAEVTQQSLRESIAYVSQDSSLFHRTLKENISYAKPDATMDEIIAVAKKAHADDFISKLPDGYDSLVGERGIKLSGGERQRVAIARAMLKDAPIIVLDEATSALDSISENKIQDAFKALMEGKTTIVIAHRLSTIHHMDRIVVFDEGRIVEIGSHTELLARNGTYAQLWNSQVGGFMGG